MRKTFLSATSALALMSGAAYAADVYEGGGSMKDPMIPVSETSWNGFYIGGSAGFGVGKAEHTTDVEVLDVEPGSILLPPGLGIIDVDLLIGVLPDGALTALLTPAQLLTLGGLLGGGTLPVTTTLGAIVSGSAFTVLTASEQLAVLAAAGVSVADIADIRGALAVEQTTAAALLVTSSAAAQAELAADLGGGIVLGTDGILGGLLTTITSILGPILAGDGEDDFGSLGATGRASSTSNLSGAVFGAHAGYNFQMPGGFLIGFEGQINGTDMTADDICGPTTCEHDINYYATGELRLGYAMNDALFYIHGGYAYANMDSKWFGEDYEDDRDGFVVGVGAEYKLTQNFSLRVAYSHIEFEEGDEQSAQFITPTSDGGAALIGVTDESELTIDTITVGASVHF